ncbi:hypothetical protein V2A60_006921 [Cordyceps javanica]
MSQSIQRSEQLQSSSASQSPPRSSLTPSPITTTTASPPKRMWTTTAGLDGQKLRLAIALASVVGFSLFGYNQRPMSGIISGEQFTQEFPAAAAAAGVPEGASGAHLAPRLRRPRRAITSCYELGCLLNVGPSGHGTSGFQLIVGKRFSN